jgi:hypothetical protein
VSRTNVWLWLVSTTKGKFFISFIGGCDQAAAAKKVWRLFELLGLDITALQDRKRATGPGENTCTLVEQPTPENELGCDFMGGRDLYRACGRLAEYGAESILLEVNSRLTFPENNTRR